MMMEGVRMGACQRATAPIPPQSSGTPGRAWTVEVLDTTLSVNMEGQPGGGGGWSAVLWNSGQQGLPENQSTSGMSKDTQARLLDEGTHSQGER